VQESDNDRKFAILIGMLGTAFGEKGINAARIEIYQEHLKDIPIDELARAVQFIIKNRKFSTIPTIAEIRETALGRDEDIEIAALEAWGRASRAVGRSLYLRDDPALDEAVRVAFGGWERFGETDPENVMADRAHFLRVFKGLAKARRDRGMVALPPARENKKLKEGKNG
jgi:hypothetical protein